MTMAAERKDLQEVANAMRDIMRKEGACFAVPANGRGAFIFDKDAPNPFDPNDNSGLMRTDKLVLVFEDVIIKGKSTKGEPPYCDPERLDLCPNIRRVKLSDYEEGRGRETEPRRTVVRRNSIRVS
jgi:hypothetical protein